MRSMLLAVVEERYADAGTMDRCSISKLNVCGSWSANWNSMLLTLVLENCSSLER